MQNNFIIRVTVIRGGRGSEGEEGEEGEGWRGGRVKEQHTLLFVSSLLSPAVVLTCGYFADDGRGLRDCVALLSHPPPLSSSPSFRDHPPTLDVCKQYPQRNTRHGTLIFSLTGSYSHPVWSSSSSSGCWVVEHVSRESFWRVFSGALWRRSYKFNKIHLIETLPGPWLIQHHQQHDEVDRWVLAVGYSLSGWKATPTRVK